MTVMVALLRGVNVGGKAKLSMADLRAAAKSIGLEDVATYVQSGNLVFRSTGTPATVAKRLRTAIARETTVDPAVVVLTRDQLRRIVRANPFLDRSDDYKHHHVLFAVASGKPSLAGLDLAAYAPEDASAAAKCIYLYLPNGMGRSKLAVDLNRKRGADGTARNWRTVTTLLAMADDVA